MPEFAYDAQPRSVERPSSPKQREEVLRAHALTEDHTESAPSRSGETELVEQEKVLVEAEATVARVEQALRRIQDYLLELRRTFGETADPGVASVIEQRTRQERELKGRLWDARTTARLASRRREELLAIFEGPILASRDPLPRAFAHIRTTFFTDLLDLNRENPFLQTEWLRNTQIRNELCEFLTKHVPHFILIQEILIRSYRNRYPQWTEEECVAYARKTLPSHLKKLALLIAGAARGIEAQDPNAPVAPIYEQAAQLLLHSFDRMGESFPDGRILWDTLTRIARPEEPVRLLLGGHKRVGGPKETREAVLHRFSDLLDTAVAKGQESPLQADQVFRAFNKCL